MLPHQFHRAAETVGKTAAHIARVKTAQKRERAKQKTRSPKWRAVRKKFLRTNAACAACGGRVGLQVHHVRPFHLDPKLELDPTNLIALCETVGGLECHEFLGHGDHWQSFNPNVRVDAAALMADPTALSVVRSRAKAARRKAL